MSKQEVVSRMYLEGTFFHSFRFSTRNFYDLFREKPSSLFTLSGWSSLLDPPFSTLAEWYRNITSHCWPAAYGGCQFPLPPSRMTSTLKHLMYTVFSASTGESTLDKLGIPLGPESRSTIKTSSSKEIRRSQA